MRYAIAIGVAVLGFAAPALADPWDFILVNSTGKEIKEVELSPAGAGQWQKRKFDADEKAHAIKPMARSTIHFDKAASQCKWDVKATFADDAAATWNSVNLCDNSFVTLKYANSVPSFSAN